MKLAIKFFIAIAIIALVAAVAVTAMVMLRIIASI